MIIFLSILALIVIWSSHRADEKVHEITRLKEQVAELRSEAVDSRVSLWKLKTSSSVARALEARGVKPANVPPKKIKVRTKQEQ